MCTCMEVMVRLGGLKRQSRESDRGSDDMRGVEFARKTENNCFVVVIPHREVQVEVF